MKMAGWRRLIKERRKDCLKDEVILKLKYGKKMRFRDKDKVGRADSFLVRKWGKAE
jgi:hypothetical protein